MNDPQNRVLTTEIKVQSARKINECIAAVKHTKWPERLFDEFWCEGELALLFGPPGVGKSILAVQIADALARGRAIGTFSMPMYRRRTLYVDMVMSDAKFRQRYSYFPEENREQKVYKFSENLFYERPAPGEALGPWLREKVRASRIEVVIIDDLRVFSRTCDGTREMLGLMRDLKQISDEMGVSVLVLATSSMPGRSGLVSEMDLRRSRGICNVADRVFAIGFHPKSAGDRYVIQMRSRNSEIRWTADNAPICKIGRSEEMLLSMVFDHRFAAKMSPELGQLICGIKAMSEGGKSYRKIAMELGVPVSRVSRLIKKWKPEMEEEEEKRRRGEEEKKAGTMNEHEITRNHTNETGEEMEEQDEWDEAGFEKPEWIEEEGAKRSGGKEETGAVGAVAVVDRAGEKTGTTNGYEMIQNVNENPTRAQPPANAGGSDKALGRRNVYDLEVTLNAYGREIYVDKWDEIRHKPAVWYEFNKQGVLMKSVRTSSGIMMSYVGKTRFL